MFTSVHCLDWNVKQWISPTVTDKWALNLALNNTCLHLLFHIKKILQDQASSVFQQEGSGFIYDLTTLAMLKSL